MLEAPGTTRLAPSPWAARPIAEIHTFPCSVRPRCIRSGLHGKDAKTSAAPAAARPDTRLDRSPMSYPPEQSTDNTCSAARLRSRRSPPRTLPTPKKRMAGSSLLFTGLVLVRIRGANQSVRTALDRGRKFPQILANVPHIFEQFVDILGIDLQRLVEPRGQVRHVHQRVPQFDHRLMNVGPILPDQPIDVIQSLVCFVRRLPEIVE